jgi:DNA-binding NtrC family response regulator
VPLKLLARDAIRELGRNVIAGALRANHWNRRKTAEELRISYRALIYRIRDSGLVFEPAEMTEGPQVNTGDSPDSHAKI